MTVRQTSIDAYRAINDEGLLARRLSQVYNGLFEYGPCTANELHDYLDHTTTGQANDNVSTRLGELRDFGVVSEIGKRPCSVTNRMCILWDVNDKLPIKPQRTRLTNKEKIKRLKSAYMVMINHVPNDIKQIARDIVRGKYEGHNSE